MKGNPIIGNQVILREQKKGGGTMLKKFVLVLSILLVALPAWSGDFQGQCGITFTGTSTLHDFSGKVPCQPFILALSDAGDAHGGNITVAVAQMDTDNSARDKKLRAMFDSERYPLITGTYSGFNFEETLRQALAAPEEQTSFAFKLRIREIEHPVHAALRNLKQSPQGLFFSLQFEVSLADYQLRPPSVLGMIRVGDSVDVQVDVQLQQLPPPGVTAQ